MDLLCHRLFNALRLLPGTLLLLLLLAACAGGSSSSSDGDGDSESDACLSSEQESVPATFTHTVSSGVLNLAINQSGAGEHSLLYCVPAPHTGNYRGIEADATFNGSTASSGDINLLMTLYETSGGARIFVELILRGMTATAFVESCNSEDVCDTLQPDTTIATGLTQGNTYTISILWNGSNTISYNVGGTPGSYTIDLGAYPIVNSTLTDAEIAFDLYARLDAGGSALTEGTIDNVKLSTDGSTFTTYDDFSVADGSYTGGSKWYLYTGAD